MRGPVRGRPSATIRPVPLDPGAAPVGVSEVEVRRSPRRTRSVSAHRDGTRVVVSVPARFTAAEEDRWVTRMLARLARPRRRAPADDAELAARARALSTRYLDGRARPASVVWSARQLQRWGSCTPADSTIRVSDRLRDMPAFVLDHVLLHELAHLLEPDHGPAFQRLLERHPQTQRALGFLDGVDFAGGVPPAPSEPAATDDGTATDDSTAADDSTATDDCPRRGDSPRSGDGPRSGDAADPDPPRRRR